MNDLSKIHCTTKKMVTPISKKYGDLVSAKYNQTIFTDFLLRVEKIFLRFLKFEPILLATDHFSYKFLLFLKLRNFKELCSKGSEFLPHNHAKRCFLGKYDHIRTV